MSILLIWRLLNQILETFSSKQSELPFIVLFYFTLFLSLFLFPLKILCSLSVFSAPSCNAFNVLRKALWKVLHMKCVIQKNSLFLSVHTIHYCMWNDAWMVSTYLGISNFGTRGPVSCWFYVLHWSNTSDLNDLLSYEQWHKSKCMCWRR